MKALCVAILAVVALLTGACSTAKSTVSAGPEPLTTASAKRMIQERFLVQFPGIKPPTMQVTEFQVENMSALILDTETVAECRFSGRFSYSYRGKTGALPVPGAVAKFQKQPDGGWVCTHLGPGTAL